MDSEDFPYDGVPDKGYFRGDEWSCDPLQDTLDELAACERYTQRSSSEQAALIDGFFSQPGAVEKVFEEQADMRYIAALEMQAILRAREHYQKV